MTTELLNGTESPDPALHEGSTSGENLVATAIDLVEAIPDPLDGLIDRVTDDPGAPFAPAVLETARGHEESPSGRV